MLKKLVVQNFKVLDDFSLELNDDLNVIVGNNEVGKSTILEAINLALTKRLDGRLVEYEISPHLFSKRTTEKYLAELRAGNNPDLPVIIIELYFSDDCGLDPLRGSNNSLKENSIGVALEISFNDDYAPEYKTLIEGDPDKIKLIPTEYFTAKWRGFDGNPITPRGLKVGVSYIDTTTIRLQSGTDYYMKNIVQGTLTAKEQVLLAVAYRELKEKFSEEESIKQINEKLEELKGVLSDKDFAIAMDVSQKTSWETNLTPHLDNLPFQLIGKGEQNALKIMLALERKGYEDNVILIEEPENHLSYSSMNALIRRIQDKCPEKQLIIATHSAYVVNKLGLEKLILLSSGNSTKLTHLPKETQDYFKKLSGYDTLRLILAEKAILVEGPSDELVVQKAYLRRYGKLPIEDKIDVINLRGLSFKRFLDIAKELATSVAVVTDNDGNYKKNVADKYKDYFGVANIAIYADKNDDFQTLESQMAHANGIPTMNNILGKEFANIEEIITYMTKPEHKTDCALKIFDYEGEITFPAYIDNAIAK